MLVSGDLDLVSRASDLEPLRLPLLDLDRPWDPEEVVPEPERDDDDERERLRRFDLDLVFCLRLFL